MRRILIILFVLILLGAAGWLGYQEYQRRTAAANEPQFETTAVARGQIASTISATGSIAPAAEVSLSFRGGGLVERVLVAEGDPVVAGQLLVELESTDLILALAQAEVAQEISAAQLAKLETPPSENDLAAAQAAVQVAQTAVGAAEAALNSAQAAYRDLLAGPSETELTINEAQVRQAEADVKAAQEAYNDIRFLPNAGALPQSARLEQATIALEAAKAQAALTLEPPSEAQLASALNAIAQAESTLRQSQSNLITAQNNLDQLLEGPDENDLRVARAQLRQADLNIMQAEANLRDTRLHAPIDGVVSVVNVREGELAAGGLPAFVLTDLSGFHMDVLVDEIDVRQLAVGQSVRISVDALPETDLTGRVTEVAPTASDVGGVIAYAVTIVPDPTDAPLRAGMSATAIITTAQVEDVLLVPNRFIQLDRAEGRAYVYKVVNDEPVLQEVELGLRNEQFSQILAGLTDGDVLALITQSSEERLRGALFGDE